MHTAASIHLLRWGLPAAVLRARHLLGHRESPSTAASTTSPKPLDDPCIPVAPLVSDSFTRLVVDGWGSPDVGPGAYTLSGGTNPDNYDVNAGRGFHNMDSVNVRGHSFVTGTGATDQNVYVTAYLPIASTTGGSITQWLLGRVSDVNNWYSARIELNNMQQINLVICKRAQRPWSPT